MKKIIPFTAFLACVAASAIADDSAKDEVTRAAKALAAKPNYSWTSKVEVPDDARFRPGPTDGKVEKDGPLHISQSFGQGTMEIVKHGEKAALTNRDGGWQSLSEAENAEGFGRFRAGMARNLKAPAEQALDLIQQTKSIKKEGDVYSADLTEEGAKSLVGFGGRGGGGNVSYAIGSVKFWVKDGVLSKMELKVDGSVEFNGNEIDVVRTTITEIKDIGTTKVQVPEGAKSKLG